MDSQIYELLQRRLLDEWDTFQGQLRGTLHKASVFSDLVQIISNRDPNIECPSDAEFWELLNQEAMKRFSLLTLK